MAGRPFLYSTGRLAGKSLCPEGARIHMHPAQFRPQRGFIARPDATLMIFSEPGRGPRFPIDLMGPL